MSQDFQIIRFILNQELVEASVPPGMLALDYVRQERQLCGTKLGCKEGDCGACNVIVGELNAEGAVEYRPMTSCLLPMGELSGKHLVTIEGLNGETLSPVQAAMVDCGGTQCGFCTPGFVVAMTAGLMEPRLPLNQEGMLYAISGNLCRCTGYRSIKAAGMQVMNTLADRLADQDRIRGLCQAGALPPYFETMPVRLAELQANLEPLQIATGDALPVAGGTDLYVQRGETLPDIPVNLLRTQSAIPAACVRGDCVVVDARMTFEAFSNDPLIQSYVPNMKAYNLLIASWPVRTRATLGGNICNASPIADMTCLLLALESVLVLRKDGIDRELPLKDFYLGYKELNKAPEEIVVEVRFPKPGKETHIHWEKVSKRAWLDIATVNSAIKLEMDGDRVVHASLALGGVAATPLYLPKASEALTEKTLSIQSVTTAIDCAMGEFSPISDVRGSADYKRLLAHQLLWAHFTTLFPETFKEEAVYATLR